MKLDGITDKSWLDGPARYGDLYRTATGAGENGKSMSLERQNLDIILQEDRMARAPDWNEGAYFNFFVTEQIVKNSGASVDNIMDAIVDGGNDCGVDSIMFLIDDIPASHYPSLDTLPSDVSVEMVVIQAKHSTSFEERPLLEMASSFPRLLDRQRDEDSLAIWCNSRLLERTGEFLSALPYLLPKFPKITATVYYASRGDKPHPKVEQRAEQLCEAITSTGQFAEARAVFLGVTDLLRYARQQNRTSFSIKCATQPMASPDGNGYVGLVKLPDYRNFVITDDGRDLNTQLFEANVRDHEGANEVNAAIRQSLDGAAADDFWWLNNGVTIVADRAMPNGHELILESPQVVNGLQTSTEVWLSSVETSDERLILVRVIKATDPSVRDRIIQATNYQTAIPRSALRATDPIQRNLEDWFKQHQIYYDRRRNYYANLNYPIDQIISMSTLAEAVASCLLQEPHMARSRGNQLMSNDVNYARVFESQVPEFYLMCLKIIDESRRAVNAHPAIKPYNADDWLYHLACVGTILYTRKDRPSDRDIANISMDDITAPRLGDLIPLVARSLAGGRSSTLPLRKQAENPLVTSALLRSGRDLLRNSRWHQWPSVEVEDDFIPPASRLDPSRRRSGN